MKKKGLTINELEYFEMPGLNVLVYQNTFAEGHQSGVEIIQHGERVATNGELRLSPAPGQWQPVPEIGGGFQHVGVAPQTVALSARRVDRAAGEISMPCRYPDPARHRRGFNPLVYPDLKIEYTVRVRAEGAAVVVTVDLGEPLPPEWVGRVGYSLELFPGDLYGKTYYMDGRPGYFPRQAGGPTRPNADGEPEAVPLAEGRTLVVAPESDRQRLEIESRGAALQLLDGSLQHNNGWFIVRSLVPAGAARGAVEWKITPHVIPGWKPEPVIHLSQAGYHPAQRKTAFLELEKTAAVGAKMKLQKITPAGARRTVLERKPSEWGPYLRYRYATFDFTEVTEPGVYVVRCGGAASHPFPIDRDVYKRNVWQPTLEYFLPMQMCHMRVNQKYRVWHGVCHLDDALMAPAEIDHFDGYGSRGDPAPAFRPLEHVAGFDAGGWHDAGDDDIRTDTQVNTVIALSHLYEEFGVDYDQTLIDPAERLVEIHQPDGKPDVLQQIEHGVTWILNFYKRFGYVGLGVIVPSLRQYVLQGDPSTQTDNRIAGPGLPDSRAATLTGMWYAKVANRYSKIFDPEENRAEIEETVPELDDRLAFAPNNAMRQLFCAGGLAIAARVLRGYNDGLAADCLTAAETLWAENSGRPEPEASHVFTYNRLGNLPGVKLHALVELYLTTKKEEYRAALLGRADELEQAFPVSGWALGRALPFLDDPAFRKKADAAARRHAARLSELFRQSPFGSPLAHTEAFGLDQYFLHKGWPDIFSIEPLFDILNFLLGCKPGKSTSSLVSGVGMNSPVVAYGFNRADWSYIPGGTFWNAVNLVRPDLAEDKVWPFLWQEREYITDAACLFLFMAVAADRILETAKSPG